MADKKANKKRVVSVGLFSPKRPEKDTIYISLLDKSVGNDMEILVEAVSTRPFKYHLKDKEGNLTVVESTNASNREEGGIHITYGDYNKFIKDIVGENGAIIEYDRLYIEAARARKELVEIIGRVNKLERVLGD